MQITEKEKIYAAEVFSPVKNNLRKITKEKAIETVLKSNTQYEGKEEFVTYLKLCSEEEISMFMEDIAEGHF